MMPPPDLADEKLWQSEDAVQAAFARLRTENPVSWQRESAHPGVEPGPGYWAVVRHRDAVTVSTKPERFSSAAGTSIRSLPATLNEFLGSMLNMDDPGHAQLRRIVSRAFTPRRLQQLATRVDALANELLQAVQVEGGGDLVAAIAAPLPLRVIGELLGIPEDDWDNVAQNGEILATSRDAHSMLTAAQHLHDCAARLAATRREHPHDDLVSALAHANLDGEHLTPTQIGSFFTLLVVAGAQTTRHVISTGLVALAQHPDQRHHWATNLDTATPAAIDELIRWATPVRHFRRTATTDTTLNGTPIRRGDKVVIWYTSANHDDDTFDHPEQLNLTRTPNPHLAFGTGPHACLGATLARHELTAIFTAVLQRQPYYRVTHTERTVSSFVAGYHHVHCEL
jgi:cytochrome P450